MELYERLRELRKKAGYSQETLAEIYQVSTDFILLGTESKPVNPIAKKELHPETRKTLNIIAVTAAIALIMVLLITALGLISNLIW